MSILQNAAAAEEGEWFPTEAGSSVRGAVSNDTQRFLTCIFTASVQSYACICIEEKKIKKTYASEH